MFFLWLCFQLTIISLGLTTVVLIGSVSAVIVGVTEPCARDAVMVGAAELVGLASARALGGTLPLVTAIKTVIVSVAVPASGHTVLIGTGKGNGRACVVCEPAE